MVLYTHKHDQVKRGLQSVAASDMPERGLGGFTEDRLVLVRVGFIWLLLAAVCAVALFCLHHYFYAPSQMRQARLHLSETAQSIKEYKIVHGILPQKLETLSSLRTEPAMHKLTTKATTAKQLLKPRLRLSDPWGQPIVYRKTPSVALISNGPDGRPSADDIILNVNADEEIDTYIVQGKEESHETNR